MSLYLMWEDIKAHGFETAIVIILILKLIDITPLKINPWSAILKGIQKFFTGNIAKQIVALEEAQRELQKSVSKANDMMRNRISEIDAITEKKFKLFSEKLDRIENKRDKSDALNSRYRIISAADALRSGKELSHDLLEQLGEDIEIYTKYTEEHPDYRNHKGQLSMRLILDYEESFVRKEAEENHEKRLKSNN